MTTYDWAKAKLLENGLFANGVSCHVASSAVAAGAAVRNALLSFMLLLMVLLVLTPFVIWTHNFSLTACSIGTLLRIFPYTVRLHAAL